MVVGKEQDSEILLPCLMLRCAYNMQPFDGMCLLTIPEIFVVISQWLEQNSLTCGNFLNTMWSYFGSGEDSQSYAFLHAKLLSDSFVSELLELHR